MEMADIFRNRDLPDRLAQQVRRQSRLFGRGPPENAGDSLKGGLHAGVGKRAIEAGGAVGKSQSGCAATDGGKFPRPKSPRGGRGTGRKLVVFGPPALDACACLC
jgi:hypothetical protein